MLTERIEVNREQARELYRAYRKHQHWSQPIDREVQRTYQLIAQGRVVIKALESIKAAGVDALGFPKLALMRADQERCWARMYPDGGAEMQRDRWARNGDACTLRFVHGTFPARKDFVLGQAIAPLIPLHLRPKRGLQSYHVLWEAEWTKSIPVDPMLLRRIGKGDLWVVVAAWDLTIVEQAALAARVMG